MSSRALVRRVLLASLALFVITTASAANAADAGASLAGVVNLNTATIEELKLLPGVGESRAAAIVTLRNELGGFTDVEDLLAVKGVGEKLLDRMRPHVTLEGETTAARS